MITSKQAKEIFKNSLDLTGSLDDALNQVVAAAYRAGHLDAGGIAIYTDGVTDTYLTIYTPLNRPRVL